MRERIERSTASRLSTYNPSRASLALDRTGREPYRVMHMHYAGLTRKSEREKERVRVTLTRALRARRARPPEVQLKRHKHLVRHESERERGCNYKVSHLEISRSLSKI